MTSFIAFDTATVVALIVSVVIPFLSSLLARTHWDQFWTGVITLALSAANGFFTDWAAQGSSFDWRHALALAVASYVVAVLARAGLLRGTQVDAKLLAFPKAKQPVPAHTPEHAAA